jgi:hypothetical protein
MSVGMVFGRGLKPFGCIAENHLTSIDKERNNPYMKN